jgi:hypothetical protein
MNRRNRAAVAAAALGCALMVGGALTAPGAAGAAPASAPHPAAPTAPAALSAASAASAGAAAPGRLYEVRLTRPAVVGQKQLAVGSLETEDLTSWGGEAAPGGAPKAEQPPAAVPVTSAIHYVVATEILEVGPKGNALRASITVRRLTKESGGISAELAKPGELYTARLAGRDRIIEQAGTPVAADLQQALSVAVPLRSDEDPTDDDLFGTAQQRRVADSWQANVALFAQAGAQRVVFEPKSVAGTVTLAGVKELHGQPCLDVRWQLDAAHGSFKAGSLPGNLKGVMTSMTVTGAAVVPVAPALSLPLFRETTILGIGDFTGTAPGGDTLTMHRRLRQVFRLELTKVP